MPNINKLTEKEMKLMNPMTGYKRVTANGLFIFLLLLITAITFPSNVVFAYDPPLVAISSPANNQLLSDTKVVIKGTFNTVKAKNLLLTAYEGSSDKISDNKTINEETKTSDWSIDTQNKTWSFTRRLSEGKHNIKIEIKDQSDQSIVDSSTVTLYIYGTGIVLPDQSALYGEDLTNIPKNPKIKFTIVDQNSIAQIDEGKAIKVMQGNSEITGTSTLHDLNIPGMNAYSITFKPDVNLQLNKSFTASLDPSSIGDPAINKINRKSFKFTTKTNADWADYDDENHKTSSNPHGHYTLNTNMCSTCHSTHKGSTDTLEVKPSDDATQNYCMACHDGTLNAPAIDNQGSKNHHTAGVDKTQQQSCTTCHNPHLDWSEDNPNLLKDHYVYKHNADDLNQRGLTSLKVDSLDNSCINCHEENTALDTSTNTNKSIFDSTTFKNGYYEFLQYKKALTADGSMDNYSLCLSCHTDIKKYYKDGVATQHSITAQDGSKLQGFMPCAECHETHGSNNSFLLKSTFGHDNPTSGFTFTGDIKSWDANTERQFCMKCHNGSTAVYGVTAKLPSPEYHPSQTAACSLCHGTGGLNRDRILSAAHGPKYVPLSDPAAAASKSTTTETNATTTTTTGTTTSTTDPAGTTSSGTGTGTGRTPADTGSPAADTGTTPADTSTTPADTSTTPADTDTPSIEAGTTPTDPASSSGQGTTTTDPTSK
ncbi:cytochrome c3 family protein [Neobacillus cucumis]|uniref:cytochrome c3 family protein n=1 Tax=Neobacillus cucumis TaxID=1740721 RepID=UPI0028535A61|nr:cytochrome c3 family protein [Neobacillus cucumis]MDR4949453.1 cytochrome c3 family protein [Neobacillus cucumis]